MQNKSGRFGWPVESGDIDHGNHMGTTPEPDRCMIWVSIKRDEM